MRINARKHIQFMDSVSSIYETNETRMIHGAQFHI